MTIRIIAILLVVLLVVLLEAALIFFYGPDVMNLAADFAARVVAKVEKKIDAELERWQDILEDK